MPSREKEERDTQREREKEDETRENKLLFSYMELYLPICGGCYYDYYYDYHSDRYY